MTHTAVEVVQRKAPPGKPFVKGHDPRRNPGGRRPLELTAAATKGLTAVAAKMIIDQVIAQAKKGEPWAIQMLWDRLEGKAIARAESGNPGDFDLDLSAVESDEIRAALTRAK